MPKHKCKNTTIRIIWHHQAGYHMTARPDYSSAAEAQETNLKTNFMKMTEFIKEESFNHLKKSKIGGNQ